ncbi:uncharacterized protein B0H18DRAFT_474271 [Fomitopsis serialis]|uniref:uncharacterized protein n=1 Tax=Fomitopsis serialis TaxID=139415 RepID=UPI002008AF8D|nr:uncharacterized protein B0H18DRAFT_474271 [Neoantrodia serialis]KAH9923260.1 hypothetical protein B0H18DRAFT_474271 [Neoantrodia serialis]
MRLSSPDGPASPHALWPASSTVSNTAIHVTSYDMNSNDMNSWMTGVPCTGRRCLAQGMFSRPHTHLVPGCNSQSFARYSILPSSASVLTWAIPRSRFAEDIPDRQCDVRRPSYRPRVRLLTPHLGTASPYHPSTSPNPPLRPSAASTPPLSARFASPASTPPARSRRRGCPRSGGPASVRDLAGCVDGDRHDGADRDRLRDEFRRELLEDMEGSRARVGGGDPRVLRGAGADELGEAVELRCYRHPLFATLAAGGLCERVAA